MTSTSLTNTGRRPTTTELAARDVFNIWLADQSELTRTVYEKVRTVYLTETSAAALRAWLDVRESVANTGDSALFVALERAHGGGGVSTRAIRYVVDEYLADVGLKAAGISCHSLRHSAATWARAGGAKLDAIADQLGHASTDTTRIYARIVDRMTENPARYLEAVLAAQVFLH
jgi:integrase